MSDKYSMPKTVTLNVQLTEFQVQYLAQMGIGRYDANIVGEVIQAVQRQAKAFQNALLRP